jgi:glycosyltransferase involved in cell wall biosynthesis
LMTIRLVAEHTSLESHPESAAAMKLLHVVPSYAPGGHRARIALLARGLGAGFSHRVVALDGGLNAEPFDPEVALLCFAARPSKGLHIGNLKRLRVLLNEEQPNVLITYNWGTIEAALVNRLAALAPHLHCEDGFSGSAALRGEPLRRALFRRAVLARTRVVVPSRTLMEIARRRWGVPAERIELIPNGIDTERFAQAGSGRFQTPREEIVIGTLSRLSPEKNLGLCLRAFANLKDMPGLRLVIGGNGPELNSLQDLADRLGITERTRFLGHVEDAAAFLAGIDIYASGSITEQLPFSLLEAMAAGLPAAITDVGDVREALSPANRQFVIRPGDEAALAGCLRRLAQSFELRHSIGIANCQRARALFDQKLMIESYRGLLRRIADPRLSSGG